MAHWREEFAAALAARDRREKANIAIYNAYAKLADRTAAANTSHTQSPAQQSTPSTPTTDRKKQPSPTSGPSPQDLLAATRTDLAEAQRSRTELHERLARATTDLEKLRKQSNHDGRKISSMEGEITHLQLRLKDREEELRGKAKLLEDFQDELATLNLQLNMAEARTDRLQKENQELVDRWMVRMGKEADAMNDASKFS
ncbi:autophagy protein 16 [Aspergillus granulosus]|uniref:Autophagy protein 16 n=1 Tax=Aspergillus granulosus TaxID=176169 RepID=A0ABR4I1U2_9EURO